MIRPSMPSDFDALWYLERTSGMEDIWTPDILPALLDSRPDITILVLDAPPIIAYIGYHNPRPDRTHLLSIVVAPTHRRRGHALSLLASLPPLKTLCHVRESDLPSQLLLRRAGFRAKRIIPARFTSPPESSYLFTRSAGVLSCPSI